MNPEELSTRLDKLEKHVGYALGNQVSILEAWEKLVAKLNQIDKKTANKNELSVIVNYFLLSLVFYGLMHLG